MKVLIAAGGTGGHIFPALSVALEWKVRYPDDTLLWVGTSRNRERELCERHDIPLHMLDVTGLKRTLGPAMIASLGRFLKAVSRMKSLLLKEKPDAVLAFGGYVSGPVLAAAWMRHVPFYLHEQNTVPGLVNRIFCRGARRTFLGMPLALGWKLRGRTQVVGTPVRTCGHGFGDERYPEDIDRGAPTVLICGGSQGAQSMNRALVGQVKQWLRDDIQVVWQTGDVSLQEMRDVVGEHHRLFMYATISDLYPFYAIADVVVGRSGASTLAEIAYFGLPCVLIPLPWSAENHQWMNAAQVEAQGWGVRVTQDDACGDEVGRQVKRILEDPGLKERMSQHALDGSSAGAALAIIDGIRGGR